ncbi:prepilin-type N-terminal cleavage/methylation domain-containing protein [Telmatospirillum sp.]|uniref:prepilin-type N-terminal cleavage/methylation domain-containing protein n=1 Tax=Telmatospirillum sp. TaxID=2079197 RepID=UPI0028407358|nr:prepilin-type N-terminal cleavage/methylation domain-containing protein [Telmatospirillum sp.]MDR3436840.1 prepilin-type N-terminal cleavage/methylation domain-containing protein [Telmatospirillum sp.]
MSDRRRQRGFTLLEVLIALTLLGFLLAALAQGFRFGLKAWDLQAQTTMRSDSLEATDRSLRLLIEGMEPDGGGSSQTAVTGHRNGMSFVGKLPMADCADRRADMTLVLAPGGRLVLRWRPHRHEKLFGAPPAETETLLIDDVDRLELAYWHSGAPGIRGGWVDDWTEPGLPGLVRVRLRFRDGDPRHWPDMIIAPMLEARNN